MEFLTFTVVSWLILLVPGFDDSVPPTEDKIFKIEIENDGSKTIESVNIVSDSFNFSGLKINLKDNTMKTLIVKIPKNIPLPSTTYEDLESIDTNLSYDNEPFVLADNEEIHYDTIGGDSCFYKYKIPLEDQTEIELIYTVPAVGNFFLRGENLDENNICQNQVFYKPPFEPPLKQLENGIYSESIVCNEGLQLVKRINDKPSCVKWNTIPKLIERNQITPESQEAAYLTKKPLSGSNLSDHHIETVVPWLFAMELEKRNITDWENEKPYYENTDEGWRKGINMVCSPIILSDGDKMFILTTFYSAPFEITGIYIDDVQPKDCQKTWAISYTEE